MSGERVRVARFWLSDWSLSILLALLVVDIFILGPVVQFQETPRAFQPVIYSLFVVAAVPIAFRSRWHRGVAVLLGILAPVSIAMRWTSHFHANTTFAWADTIVSLVFCLALTVVVLAQAYAAGPIDLRRIQGAVAAYLLLSFAWARAYELVALSDPAAFSFPTAGLHQQTLMARLIYFSMTTLTTVGYGDVTPINPVARSLANFEGMIGQLFPAITLARLVSMEVSQRQQRGK